MHRRLCPQQRHPHPALVAHSVAPSCRPFSTLQKLRHDFVPGTPACIADVKNTKVSLQRSLLPIRDELTELFPTLLAQGAEGMQQLEIKVDPANGSILQSETPLRVSALLAVQPGMTSAGPLRVPAGILNPAAAQISFLMR